MQSFRISGMILYLFIQLLPLLSIFCSFPTHSHAYSPPERYFINCGSDSSVTDTQRSFSGDNFFTGDSTEAGDPNFPGSGRFDIYRTARVFKGISRYEFEIDQSGPYMVRLHFYPFSSSLNLSDAKFHVSASGFSLLSNFSVGKLPSTKFPVIKEFLLWVKDRKLKIYFIPFQKSSFAFVNAVEAFLAPDSSIDDEAIPVGNKMNIGGSLSSNVLDVIYRINVGGSTITHNNDTLWRNWEPDEDYLAFPESKTSSISDVDKPFYAQEWATPYDAPAAVYSTARVITINSNNSHNLGNITWRFRVNNNSPYFMRLHFSDIVSPSRNDTQFDLFVNGEFVKMVSPFDRVFAQKTPFYFDYVVDSGASGFLNVSVKPLQDSNDKSAFLNGIEIMQLSKEKLVVRDESEPKWKHLLTILGPIVAGLAFIFVAGGVALLFCLNSRKGKPVDNSDFPFDLIFGGSWQSQNTEKSAMSMSPDMNLGLKVPLAEILYATKNFDPKGMIGEGGFGKVYRGTMRNGLKVAVKRSEPGHGQGLLEFQTEIMVLSKIRHRHLVSLIGYCDERSEMILVYEFMEKGTLRDHLYNLEKPSLCSQLSWVQRLEICIGAAKGLHYLHAGLNSPIIHRDIKSTNILLDERFVAKVADFGISRSGLLDQSHVSTEVKGSFGYLDPEYYRCMQLTQKSDVYSFGVVLLEVICARAAINTSLPRDQVNLAEWGMSWQKKGQLGKIIDPLLADKINPSSLRKFGEIAEKCLQDYGVDRPSMADVMWDLEYALRLQHTGMGLDPLEDSTTDVSLRLPPPVVHRLPSHIIPVSDEEEEEEEEEDSLTTNEGLAASEVFSQLNLDSAR